MSNQNTAKKNSNGIVPKGSDAQQLGRSRPAYLANNLDRMLEDFRASFNQLMTPFVTSPYYGDPFYFPLAPERGETSTAELPARYPALDMVDDGDSYTVTAELPGFNRENVDIQVSEDALQLTARMQSEEKRRDGRYVSHERAYSAFQRSIQFPERVVAGRVEGTMKDGVLSLRIPKKEPTSAKFTKVALK